MQKEPLVALDVWTDPRTRIRELREAWERFLAGVPAADAVRRVVMDSWNRCQRQGVDPLKTVAPVVLDERELAEAWRCHLLYDDLQPVLAELEGLATHSGHLVVVTDAAGTILHLEGDAETRARAEKMQFMPGARWLEETAGTNAIGTALATGTPVQILAAEHFCEIVHPWTCAAAVVRDPVTGEALAVLDVTSLRETVHPHSLAVVMAAARAVEDKLRERRRVLELVVKNEYLREVARGADTPLAALDAGGRVVASSPWLAERGLIAPSGHLSCLQAGWLAEAARQAVEREAEGPGGQRLFVHIRPVTSGRWLAGYLVRLRTPGVAKAVAKHATTRYTFSMILGRSPRLQAALDRARLAAQHDLPVLLCGESGTGKEMVAQAIHAASRRAAGPFVAVNCGAIPPDLLASELFGYEPGAFTGARREGHRGKFEQASGGTLFLDEIGDMPLELQVYLLRVLEEGHVVRLGGSRPVPVDVRIVAATNADLQERMCQGRFRHDLYYRLSAWTIVLPALRERVEDIAELFTAFLAEARARAGRPPLSVAPEVISLLQAYSWPGNIRELKNLAWQLALEAEGPALLPEQLPPAIRAAGQGTAEAPPADAAVRPSGNGGSPSLPVPGAGKGAGSGTGTRKLQDLEVEVILQTLADCRGNVTETARRLGIHRSTVYRKIARAQWRHPVTSPAR
ncbi:MAG TPA: sigma-54-dependent Fis family transcriptional regulator [Thermaerobacter sp.]